MSALSNQRMAVYLGDGLALTRTVYGHKMFVPTQDVSLSPHLILDGFWEEWITRVFREIVRPGMSVIEIGANVGYYSLIAADLIGPQGKLTAFEANPRLAEILFRNLHINGFLERSHVIGKAAFSSTTKLQFGLYRTYLGSSSLFAKPAEAAEYRDDIQFIEVEAVTLDDHFPPKFAVDFIKIDAEGAEPHILKGANRILSENPSAQLMLEYARSFMPSMEAIRDFYDQTRVFGFRMFKIEHDSSLIELSFEKLVEVKHCDLILRR